MKKLISKVKPIETVEELANILGVSKEGLLEIAYTASKYYRPNKPKPRQTYRVLEPLRDVHERIKNNIFMMLNTQLIYRVG